MSSGPTKKSEEPISDKPTVVLVPFFGGRREHLRRHLAHFKEWGYPTAVIPLGRETEDLLSHVFSSGRGLGFKHVWADRIELELNRIPGRKIVFAMSNPSSGAIEAIGRRAGFDVDALICEGGPTQKFFNSIVKYFEHEKPLPLAPLRWLVAGAVTLLWTPEFQTSLHRDLEKFPMGFPVLSIRGWKDPLIAPNEIDLVFEPMKNLRWQKLSLPEGGHLDGLKNFENEYVPALQRFLESIKPSAVGSKTEHQESEVSNR